MKSSPVRLLPAMLFGLAFGAASALAAPGPKGPEVSTIVPGPAGLTPAELAKVSALARAYPQLGIRLPILLAPQGRFITPIVTIEHFADDLRVDLSKREASLGVRDRTKSVATPSKAPAAQAGGQK